MNIEFADETVEALNARQENEPLENTVKRVLREALDVEAPDPETLAESVLTVSDAKTADREALSASELIEQKYGIDSSEYSSESELLADVRAARKNVRTN